MTVADRLEAHRLEEEARWTSISRHPRPKIENSTALELFGVKQKIQRKCKISLTH
jgi:hypothetical protein